jgi:hypothetical protein
VQNHIISIARSTIVVVFVLVVGWSGEKQVMTSSSVVRKASDALLLKRGSSEKIMRLVSLVSECQKLGVYIIQAPLIATINGCEREEKAQHTK